MFFKREETEDVKSFYEQCQQDFINRTHNAIVSLVEENKQLKEENEMLKNGTHFYINTRGYGKTIAEENFRLKSVLKEIRKYIKTKEKDGTLWSVKVTDELLEKIDKGIGEE